MESIRRVKNLRLTDKPKGRTRDWNILSLTMGKSERAGKHPSDLQRLPSLLSELRANDQRVSLWNFSFTGWWFNDRRSITKRSFPFFLGITNSKLLNPGEDFFETISMSLSPKWRESRFFRYSLLLLTPGSGKGIGLVLNGGWETKLSWGLC